MKYNQKCSNSSSTTQFSNVPVLNSHINPPQYTNHTTPNHVTMYPASTYTIDLRTSSPLLLPSLKYSINNRARPQQRYTTPGATLCTATLMINRRTASDFACTTMLALARSWAFFLGECLMVYHAIKEESR